MQQKLLHLQQNLQRCNKTGGQHLHDACQSAVVIEIDGWSRHKYYVKKPEIFHLQRLCIADVTALYK